MTKVYCHNCTYSTLWGKHYCGKGMKVVGGECSGYLRGMPAIDVPTPYRAKGCFLPVHSVTNSNYPHYQIMVPPTGNATAMLMHSMAVFLREGYHMYWAIREYCLFDEDYYGNPYPATPEGIKSGGVGLNVLTYSKYEVWIEWIVMLGGKYKLLAGHSECDIPPHYWWLDITAPYEDLLPMHNLIRAVYTTIMREHVGYETLGPMMREVLVIGLGHRGRPLREWAIAIRDLGVRMHAVGVEAKGYTVKTTRYHRKGYARRLLREWAVLNAIAGY